jgi:hypothetical protein
MSTAPAARLWLVAALLVAAFVVIDWLYVGAP